MLKPCERCGKEIHTFPSKLARGKDKYCSRSCANIGRVELKCAICGKQFTTHQCKLKTGRGKYCSRKCYELSKRGKPSWNKGLSNTWAIGNKYRLGKGNSNPHKMFGTANHKWKGNSVGYYGLHNWVRRELGKPQNCEHCKNNNLKPRQYHWANKSQKYLRDKKDWIRLCVPCHKKYDSKN